MRPLLAAFIAAALLPGAGYLRAQDRPASAPETISTLQAEVERNPDRRDLLLQLANLCVRSGRYDAAIDAFHRLLTAPDLPPKEEGDLYLRLGETYRRKGDLESALTALRSAGARDPENKIILSTLALVLDQSGRITEAEEQYRAVLKLDSGDLIALNNLAYLLVLGDRLDEALPLATHAWELKPDMAEITDTLSWIYVKMERAGDAIALLGPLVARAPRNAIYRYHFAAALLAKGDGPAAREQLEAGLKCEPDQATREKIQALLESLVK